MNVNLYPFKLHLFKFLSRFKTDIILNREQLLRIFVFFCLSSLLASCEKGIFDPQPSSQLNSNCLETRQYDDAGQTIERVYDGRKVTKYQYLQYDTLRYYYDFTYDGNGRITKSQYVNALNPTAEYLPEMITYNDKGKWAKSTFTYPNGDITTQSVEYDNQDQIQKITSSTNKSDTTTVNFTATYTWVDGNNISRTYESPAQKTVVQYEFDLDQENKRRKEQEKLSFFSLAVAYNKNMYRRSTTTNTTGFTTTETVNEYNYELDEKGYPYRVTRITTGNNYSSPSSNTTYFEYDCN